MKVPEGLPRFLPVGRDGRLVPLEQVLTDFLPSLFPGMEVLERSLFRVTRDADFEVSDEADDLLEAVEVELRRARFGEVTRLEVSGSMSQSLRERLQQGLGVADDLVYPIAGTFDLADAMELMRVDRPDLKNDPWIPVARPPLAGLEAGEQFAAIRAGDILVHHPYDSFAASFEAFLNACADRPGRDRAEVDGVPHRRRHAARPGADRGVGARQAERVPRRDQGSRRRAAQHRMVPRARAGGRARRLRLPLDEDPREDDARRAARGRRAAPLRPSRHRQLQQRHGPLVRGLRTLHRGRGHRRRRRRPVQLPDRLRAAGALPQAARRAVHAAAAAARRDQRRGRGARARARRRASASR